MEPEPSAEPALPPGATPIKGPASRLARNMTASLAVPTATSFRDVPVVTLAAMRTGLNEQLAPRKISFTHLIGWAIVRAAGDAPAMTNYFHESDGAAYRVDPGGVNLGLAVDVERPDGSRLLVVPVIKGADGMDFADFVGRYEDLVERARSNGLSPDDMAGATITLTNPGTLGTTASVPRLMPNQGAIVATGAIRETGAGRVMTITSTYDHRVIQGAESGSFLRQIDGLLAGAGDFYPDVFSSLAADFAKAPRIEAAGEPVATAGVRPLAATSTNDLKAVAAAVALVRAYRSFGHLAARLDPLGSPPPGDPALDPEPLGLTPEIMARIPAPLLRVDVPGETLAEVLPALRATYCGTIAYEVEHLASHEERLWLRRVIESNEHRRALNVHEQRALLQRLTAGGRARTLPASGLPGPEALQHRRAGRHGPGARPGADRRGRGRRSRGRDRDGAPRPAERAGPHRGRHLRGDPGGVRGRARRARRAEGRLRRREVPPRRGGHLPDAGRHRAERDAVAEPQPSGGGQPGGRGPRPRPAERSPHAGPGRRSPEDAADPDPWRRGLRRAGRGGGDLQHGAAGRLHHRRHASTSSPTTRSASPPDRPKAVQPPIPATWPRASTCRSSTSTPTTRRPPWPQPGWR